MKKVTKILSIVLVIALVMTLSAVLFACGDEPNQQNTNTNTNTKQEEIVETGKLPLLDFDLKVVDIDGKVLFDGTLHKYEENETLFDIMKKNLDVVYTTSDYGPYITRINGSFVSTKTGLSFTKNGVTDWNVTAETVTINEGDKIVFTNALYNNDGLQDKLDLSIKKYIENVLPATYLARTTFKDSNYWLDTIILKAKEIGGTVDFVANTEFLNSLDNVKYDELKEAEWGKLYLALVANNKSIDTFKVEYQKALDNLSITSFNQYSTPFFMIPANALGMTSPKLTTLINNTDAVVAPKEYPDGALWLNTSIANLKETVASVVDGFVAKFDTYDNITNQFNILALCAATNDTINAQTVAGKLVSKINEDGYFKADSTKSIYNASANYSVNQIYAYLITYRSMVINNKASNVFA